MLSPGSENEVVKLLKKRDKKALSAIFKLYHKSLYYFTRQLIDDREVAEEVIADAFGKLWLKSYGFDNLASIRTFMYLSIRSNCCIYLKQAGQHAVQGQDIANISGNDEYMEDKALRADLLQVILQEAESFEPVWYEIFKMTYFEDRTVFEIATHLNITVDSVRVKRSKLLQRLRTIVPLDEIVHPETFGENIKKMARYDGKLLWKKINARVHLP